MSRHTTGPWMRINRFVYALTTNQYGREVNRFSCVVQPDNHLASAEELEANASLIAAAPDLLEALINCRSLMAALGSASDTVIALADMEARAAIAKAQGTTELLMDNVKECDRPWPTSGGLCDAIPVNQENEE